MRIFDHENKRCNKDACRFRNSCCHDNTMSLRKSWNGMEVYSKGRDLQKLGVISGEDMLPETAFVKLAWLLGNYPKEKVKELVGKNLRGEISERTDIRSTL